MCAPVFEFVHVFCQVFGCDQEAANEELAYTIRLHIDLQRWFYFPDLEYQYLRMLCLKTCCWLRLQDGSSLYLPPTLGRDTSAYWDTSQLFENSFQNISAANVEHQSWAEHYIQFKGPADLIQTSKIECQHQPNHYSIWPEGVRNCPEIKTMWPLLASFDLT